MTFDPTEESKGGTWYIFSCDVTFQYIKVDIILRWCFIVVRWGDMIAFAPSENSIAAPRCCKAIWDNQGSRESWKWKSSAVRDGTGPVSMLHYILHFPRAFLVVWSSFAVRGVVLQFHSVTNLYNRLPGCDSAFYVAVTWNNVHFT